MLCRQKKKKKRPHMNHTKRALVGGIDFPKEVYQRNRGERAVGVERDKNQKLGCLTFHNSGFFVLL